MRASDRGVSGTRPHHPCVSLPSNQPAHRPSPECPRGVRVSQPESGIRMRTDAARMQTRRSPLATLIREKNMTRIAAVCECAGETVATAESSAVEDGITKKPELYAANRSFRTVTGESRPGFLLYERNERNIQGTDRQAPWTE